MSYYNGGRLKKKINERVAYPKMSLNRKLDLPIEISWTFKVNNEQGNLGSTILDF